MSVKDFQKSTKSDEAVSRELLEKMYVEQNMGSRAIGERLGMSPKAVLDLLRENGIGIRSRNLPDIGEDVLRNMYVDNSMTQAEIASQLGVSPSFVGRQIKEHGISRPSKSEKTKLLTKELLEEKYLRNEMTAEEIAKEMGVCKRSVLLRLHDYGIPVRQNREYRKMGDISPAEIEEMERKFVVGRMSVKTLAKSYNVFVNEMYDWVHDNEWLEQRERYEDSLIEEIIDENPTASYSEIVRSTGLPRCTVVKRCNEMGIVRNPPSTKVFDKERALSLYVEQAMSVSSVADAIGASYSAVYNFLKEQGVMRPVSSSRIDVDVEMLYQRYVIERASYEDICNEFKISPVTLNRLLKRNNIELNRAVQHEEEWAAFDSFVRNLAKKRQSKIGILELSRYFNVSTAAVRLKIRHFGLHDLINTNVSCEQQKWTAWLRDEGIEFVENDRSVLSPLEIDLYIPRFGIGIEINPTATHNSDVSIFPEGSRKIVQSYHQSKSRKAERAGIRLFHVFDWYSDDIVKEMILGICGRNERMYARNTVVDAVNVREEKDFLDKYHLQGYVASEVAYGLRTSSGELVSIMTFTRPRYGNKDTVEWEMLRFCSLSGINIVGGASKLFTAFVKEHNPSSVMSFANFDVSTGTLYEALGFKFSRYTRPAYRWVRLNDPSENYSWQLVNNMGYDKLFGTDYGKGTSNTDLMLQNGFVRVYDAGNKVYVWSRD